MSADVKSKFLVHTQDCLFVAPYVSLPDVHQRIFCLFVFMKHTASMFFPQQPCDFRSFKYQIIFSSFLKCVFFFYIFICSLGRWGGRLLEVQWQCPFSYTLWCLGCTVSWVVALWINMILLSPNWVGSYDL